MKKASTLLELILYVTIVGIILGSLVPAAWSVIEGGAKGSAQGEVTSAARNLMERIKYEIRNAKDVSAVTGSSLTLINYSGPNTVIDRSGTKVRINKGLGNVDLNSDATNVTMLQFNDFSSGDGKTKNIQILLTVTDNYSTAVRQEYHKTVQLETSVELRGI